MLDSGSDGDIIFVRVGTDEAVPYKRSMSPLKWRTSNGTFNTEKVGDALEFSFPEFNESKRVTIRPDIVELPKWSPQPAYDIIIGCETLANLGCILNFNDRTLTIDQHTFPMRSHDIEKLQEVLPYTRCLPFASCIGPRRRRVSAKLNSVSQF